MPPRDWGFRCLRPSQTRVKRGRSRRGRQRNRPWTGGSPDVRLPGAKGRDVCSIGTRRCGITFRSDRAATAPTQIRNRSAWTERPDLETTSSRSAWHASWVNWTPRCWSKRHSTPQKALTDLLASVCPSLSENSTPPSPPRPKPSGSTAFCRSLAARTVDWRPRRSPCLQGSSSASREGLRSATLYHSHRCRRRRLARATCSSTPRAAEHRLGAEGRAGDCRLGRSDLRVRHLDWGPAPTGLDRARSSSAAVGSA